MTPVIFSFSELTVIDFNDFTLSSSHFVFDFDEVQHDFSAKLKSVTHSVLIYLVFFLKCLRQHFLHYVARHKHYF